MINYVDAVIHVCLYKWNHSLGPQYPTVSDVKLPQQDAECACFSWLCNCRYCFQPVYSKYLVIITYLLFCSLG